MRTKRGFRRRRRLAGIVVTMALAVVALMPAAQPAQAYPTATGLCYYWHLDDHWRHSPGTHHWIRMKQFIMYFGDMGTWQITSEWHNGNGIHSFYHSC